MMQLGLRVGAPAQAEPASCRTHKHLKFSVLGTSYPELVWLLHEVRVPLGSQDIKTLNSV